MADKKQYYPVGAASSTAENRGLAGRRASSPHDVNMADKKPSGRVAGIKGGTQLKYLDDFIRLRCAPKLLELGVFPEAKEITESMACWNGIRLLAKRLRAAREAAGPVEDAPSDLDDAVICVGDGAAPRSASLIAFLAGSQSAGVSGGTVHGGGHISGKTILPPPAIGRSWRFISVDPMLHYDSASQQCWLDRRSFSLTPGQVGSWATDVEGLYMARAKIQEVTVRARRAIVVLMHAHVTLTDVIAALDLSEGLIGVILAPCCQWEPHLRHCFGRTADVEWLDPYMLSDKNLVRVWGELPCTEAAMRPLDGCPPPHAVDSSPAFATGMKHLAAAALLEGAGEDAVPSAQSIAQLKKPKERRLAYRAAKRLVFAQSQAAEAASIGGGTAGVEGPASATPLVPIALRARKGQVEHASVLLPRLLAGGRFSDTFKSEGGVAVSPDTFLALPPSVGGALMLALHGVQANVRAGGGEVEGEPPCGEGLAPVRLAVEVQSERAGACAVTCSGRAVDPRLPYVSGPGLGNPASRSGFAHPLRIVTVGRVASVRALSTLTFIDLYDLQGCEGASIDQAADGTSAVRLTATGSLGNLAGMLNALREHADREAVGGRSRVGVPDVVILKLGAGNADAEASAVGRRLQVCVVNAVKWPTKGGVDPEPPPSPCAAAYWLSGVRPGDVIAVLGIAGAGFPSHANFVLFATDALLLYDSVGMARVGEGVERGAQRAVAFDPRTGQYVRRRLI
jgi:hypothetical protein